jgi:hypothetical protein
MEVDKTLCGEDLTGQCTGALLPIPRYIITPSAILHEY